MCSSNAKVISPGVNVPGINVDISPNSDTQINGRPVLQPTCNRVVPRLERHHSLKSSPPPLPPPSTTNSFFTTPLSPRLKSPRPQATKRASDTNGLNSSSDKILIPKISTSKKNLERNKSSKKITSGDHDVHIEAGVFPHSTESSLNYNISSLIVDSPGSIAAVRREQMAILQAQRKMRIAHYGRSKSARFESKVVPLLIDQSSNTLLTKATNTTPDDKKRCTFITHNSDPLYVAYHDEEWGVPVHDDEMLFELLVLSGAQVGSDWTSTLKKRQDFRNAFSGFDAETVANFTEKQIISVSAEYGIDISRVRGVVDNSNQILEIRRIFGSFNKYIWGFVNHKPISTQYKSCLKIPVKTSKSESISKDMVRRGFRFVGPTVLHSFMQAAGLTNDHLITCHRHLQVQCTAFAS